MTGHATPGQSVLVLLTAAGASRRMRGRDKLLERIAGVPLMAALAQRAASTGAQVLVTLPPKATARQAAIAGLDGVESLVVEEATEGMAASLRAGAAVAFARGAAGLMVLPADMPEITAADISTMIRSFETSATPRPILRAQTGDGTTWGHPVILPRRLLSEVESLRGDTGARELLRRHAAIVLGQPLPGLRAVTDLDTPEAWQAWRAAQGGRS